MNIGGLLVAEVLETDIRSIREDTQNGRIHDTRSLETKGGGERIAEHSSCSLSGEDKEEMK